MIRQTQPRITSDIAKDEGVSAGVYPTFRPDKAWGISDASAFLDWLEKLIEETGKEISTLNDFLECLANRVNHFHEIGARLSDHSFPTFPSNFSSEEEARNIFAKVVNEENATAEETQKFTGFIMLFLGRLYSAKGWAMQSAPGSTPKQFQPTILRVWTGCGNRFNWRLESGGKYE